MDYELWGRLFLAGAKFQYTGIPFGTFREHPDQKTHDVLRTTNSLLESAAKLIKLADYLPEKTKNELLADLETYRIQYQKDHWRGTGRLARIGLACRFVTWARSWKSVLQDNLKGAV
jgi:hypothetical protein